MNKTLYRSNDQIFAGVCGGIAEYFSLDATLVRILAVFICIAGLGFPIITYIIAMILIPKKSAQDNHYIDVEPTSTFGGTSCNKTHPGAGYTSANPQAFDTSETAAVGNVGKPKTGKTGATSKFAAVVNSTAIGGNNKQPGSSQPAVKKSGGVKSGVVLGILLVGLGCMTFTAIYFHINPWYLLPSLLTTFGIIVLCTPGNNGWCLARAGNGVTLVVIGMSIQLCVLGFFSAYTFLRVFLHLWPVLLVILGLSVIGHTTRMNIFKLFGSLIFSAALLGGIWYFGKMPSYQFNLPTPIPFNSSDTPYLTFTTPASPGIEEDVIINDLDLRHDLGGWFDLGDR